MSDDAEQQQQQPEYVQTLYDFEGAEDGELPFGAGEVITVVQHDDENWWTGELNGKTGLFPSAYVEPYYEEEAYDEEDEKHIFQQGEQISGYWEADDQWYDAVIDQILDDGSYVITFTEYGDQVTVPDSTWIRRVYTEPVPPSGAPPPQGGYGPTPPSGPPPAPVQLAPLTDEQKVIKLSNEFLGQVNFSKPGRRIIAKSMLTKVCRRKDERYYFFLFNDLLVYASWAAKNQKYKLHKQLPIDTQFFVEDMPDIPNEKPNRFLIHSSVKSFIVYADNPPIKRGWLEDLTKVIQDVRSRPPPQMAMMGNGAPPQMQQQQPKSSGPGFLNKLKAMAAASAQQQSPQSSPNTGGMPPPANNNGPPPMRMPPNGGPMRMGPPRMGPPPNNNANGGGGVPRIAPRIAPGPNNNNNNGGGGGVPRIAPRIAPGGGNAAPVRIGPGAVRGTTSKYAQMARQKMGLGAAKMTSGPLSDSQKRFNAEAGGDVSMLEKDVATWSVQDVANWLKLISFAQYVDTFVENCIDGEMLVLLKESDFEKDLGMKNRLHRQRLQLKLKALKQDNQPSGSTDGSTTTGGRANRKKDDDDDEDEDGGEGKQEGRDRGSSEGGPPSRSRGGAKSGPSVTPRRSPSSNGGIRIAPRVAPRVPGSGGGGPRRGPPPVPSLSSKPPQVGRVGRAALKWAPPRKPLPSQPGIQLRSANPPPAQAPKPSPNKMLKKRDSEMHVRPAGGAGGGGFRPGVYNKPIRTIHQGWKPKMHVPGAANKNKNDDDIHTQSHLRGRGGPGEGEQPGGSSGPGVARRLPPTPGRIAPRIAPRIGGRGGGRGGRRAPPAMPSRRSSNYNRLAQQVEEDRQGEGAGAGAPAASPASGAGPKFCMNCGKPRGASTAKFCSGCGTRF